MNTQVASSDKSLYRYFAGIFSIVAGVLDIFNGMQLVPYSTTLNEWIYVATDFSILMAMIGWLGLLHPSLSRVGIIGWAIALFGVAFIVGPTANIGQQDGYLIGTAFIGTGYLLLSIDLIIKRPIPLQLPVMLLISILVSATGLSVALAGLTLILGNILLGVTFLAFGLHFLRFSFDDAGVAL